MSFHRKQDVVSQIRQHGPRTIASTVHWPDPAVLSSRPPLLICFPGGGYNRRYFDLPEPGYSQAEHHVQRGMIVVAVDHLAVGDSSIPPVEHAGLEDVAAANHQAVSDVLARIRAGSLGANGPIDIGAVIGLGQSMGGHIATIMQARHRSFDGLAVLGSSMVRTKLPSKTPWREVPIPTDADPVAAGIEAMRAVDWKSAFHWDDVPEHLVAADMAVVEDHNASPAPWRSTTVPDAKDLIFPATMARDAAAVDVPVLIGMGEFDVTRDWVREMGAFQLSRDVAVFEVPRMAHMHNFAGTRERMWRRVEAFVRQVELLGEAR